MQAGKLRHRLTIQETANGDDATGSPTQTWVDVKDTYARVEALTGKELTDAHAISGRITSKVTMRTDATLTKSNRLKFGTRILDILAVLDLDNRGREMVAMVAEVD